MCGKSVDRTSTRTQTDVVKLIAGEDKEYFGNALDCLHGCEYVANNKKSFYAERIAFEKLTANIYKKEGIAAVGKNVNNPDAEGHMLLISGTLFIDGNNGSEFKVDYINPSNAQSYRCTYEEFCSGSYNGFSVRAIVHPI